MKLPQEVIELLDELEIDDEVRLNETCYLKVLTEDGTKFEITGTDIAKILSSEDTIRRFYEALGSPEETTVELLGISLAKNINVLEDYFTYIEEV